MIFVLSFVILAVGPWPCVDKAAKNPPSTTVPPSFLRELRGKVRENVGQVEDAYPAKVNSCFEPPRCHSKISSHQVLRRSSFVQKNWRSICCVCIKYSNCLRRVNVRYSKTAFVMSIRLEKIVKLLCPPSHVPATSEPGQMFANLLKGHAVAPIILTGSSKTYTTARKDLAYYVCNLAHTIVMRSIAHMNTSL